MTGYIVADIEITDQDEYQRYARQTLATIEKYDGKFLVRGGQPETLEGNRSPKRIVIIEFPSVEQARAWYDSPEYSAIKGIRQAAAISHIMILHGSHSFTLSWASAPAMI